MTGRVACDAGRIPPLAVSCVTRRTRHPLKSSGTLYTDLSPCSNTQLPFQPLWSVFCYVESRDGNSESSDFQLFSICVTGTTSFEWHTQHHLIIRSTSLPTSKVVFFTLPCRRHHIIKSAYTVNVFRKIGTMICKIFILYHFSTIPNIQDVYFT